MVAIRPQPLVLYLLDTAPMQPETVGVLEFMELVPPWGDGTARFRVRYTPDQTGGASDLVSLSPSIATTDASRQIVGRLEPTDGAPGHRRLSGNNREGWWTWRLSARDIETIDESRSAPESDLVLGVEVRGIVAMGGRARGFSADGQVGISAEAWAHLLTTLGYRTPPSLAGLLGSSVTGGPSWSGIEARMRLVRQHLTIGQDAEALSQAYRLFDEVARNPYRASWSPVLARPDMPREKEQAIAGLLQAVATVLNKLGRHPSDDLVADGRRLMLPLDHWEAEVFVAVSQMLLAAVDRWRDLAQTLEEQNPAGHRTTDS